MYEVGGRVWTMVGGIHKYEVGARGKVWTSRWVYTMYEGWGEV